jgi:hypothetical protein
MLYERTFVECEYVSGHQWISGAPESDLIRYPRQLQHSHRPYRENEHRAYPML